jgi:protein-S-isoprenylcysteine O-methyltransferase Ste14
VERTRGVAPAPGARPPAPGVGPPRPDHAGVRFPPPLLYAGGLALALLLERAAPLGSLPRTPARALALPLLLVGAGLLAAGLEGFRRARTEVLPFRPTTALVTGGPYRLSRNPMYVALLAVYLAAALWFDVAWALVLAPLVVLAVDRLVIAREERYLEAKFGDAYRAYRARVRRWV